MFPRPDAKLIAYGVIADLHGPEVTSSVPCVRSRQLAYWVFSPLALSLFKSTGDEADNAGSHRFLAPSSIPSANLLPQTPQKKNTWSVPPPGRPAQGTRCRPQESHSRSLVSVSSDGRASTKINDNRDFRLLLFLHSVALSCNAPQRFLARQLQLTNGCQNSFNFFFFSVVSDNFCLR